MAAVTATVELFAADHQSMKASVAPPISVLRMMHQHLQKKPITSVPSAASAMGLDADGQDGA